MKKINLLMLFIITCLFSINSVKADMIIYDPIENALTYGFIILVIILIIILIVKNNKKK